ncbi:hypothetical protein J32TS6_01450 [Virgibacillus pantothenticus]|nr:hypothetical protein J32TS6_01450 [Virgibacillus pantothenticus]
MREYNLFMEIKPIQCGMVYDAVYNTRGYTNAPSLTANISHNKIACMYKTTQTIWLFPSELPYLRVKTFQILH